MMRPRVRSRLHRSKDLVWGIGAQALSSTSNFLVSALILRECSAPEFGSFAIAMSAYLLALSIGRAIYAAPLLLTSATDDPSAGTSGLSAIIGLVSAIPVLALGAIAGGQLRDFALLLSAGLPFLLMYDAYRYREIAEARVRNAFHADLIWIATLVCGLSAIYAFDFESANLIFGTWMAGAAVTLLIVQHGVFPLAIVSPRAYINEHKTLIRVLLPEAAICAVFLQMNLWALALVASTAELGFVRGSYVLIGPIFMLYIGLGPVLTVRLRERRKQGMGDALRAASAASSVVASIAMVYAMIVAVIPPGFIRHVLGATAFESIAYVPWIMLTTIAAIYANWLMILGRLALPHRQVSNLRYAMAAGELTSLIAGTAIIDARAGLGFSAVWMALCAVHCLGILIRHARVEGNANSMAVSEIPDNPLGTGAEALAHAVSDCPDIERKREGSAV